MGKYVTKPTYQELIVEFQTKYGHYQSETLNFEVPQEVRDLRMKLIDEEASEMMKAIHENDLIEIADGAADAVYVIIGAMTTYGIPFDRVFMEVHRSNMTKTAVKTPLGSKYGTKTPKGPDYLPPDIHGILFHPERKTLLEQRSELES